MGTGPGHHDLSFSAVVSWGFSSLSKDQGSRMELKTWHVRQRQAWLRKWAESERRGDAKEESKGQLTAMMLGEKWNLAASSQTPRVIDRVYFFFFS